VFVEKWRSRGLHAEHMASAHLKEYQREVDGMIESWDVKLVKRIG
jgi:quinol monooxygenase YgiN